MSQQLGRLLLIKIATAQGPRVVENMCGFRARTFNLSANEVDRTIPNCDNPGGPVQRRVRPGIAQRTFSGSGLFVSGSVSGLVIEHVNANTVLDADVIVPGVGTYSGDWMISNFELSGDVEDDLAFSATFAAADELTFTAEGGAPVNVVPPAIAGIAQVGEPLYGRTGQYGSGSPVLTWQWQTDDGGGWDDIPGLTGINIAAVDVALEGQPLRLAETATTSAGSITTYSAPTADVAAA
jgi:predicted secreted protein